MTDPTSTGLPIADTVVADAVHGSFCPKMCNHACDVLGATGIDASQPWSLHREVADLASGRTDPTTIADRLDWCTGCLRCQTACTYDQDVPSQVVAARTAVANAGAVSATARTAAQAAAGGTSPFGVQPPTTPDGPTDAATVVVVGCRDEADVLAAIARVAAAAGEPIRFVVPEGCCGGVLGDLGMAEAAADRGTALANAAGTPTDRVVTTDETCQDAAESLPGATHDLVSFLAGLLPRLTLRSDLGPVTWHDPPVLARRAGVLHAPREILGALGGQLVEPEGAGRDTVGAGTGLGFDLLQPEAARALAAHRAAMLRATGAPVVSVGPEVGALREAGLDVANLAVLLANHLVDPTSGA